MRSDPDSGLQKLANVTIYDGYSSGRFPYNPA